MRTGRRTASVALAAAAALLLTALPAFAHVEPDPARVRPGKRVTVEFAPEHGCGESVTTEIEFRVPRGAKHATPVEQDGWSTQVKGRTITFASDKVPDEETAFGIRFTAPTAKTLLPWKVIQRCQDGVERWIEGPKGELPAPIVGVGKNPPDVDTEKADESGEHG
jgi:uncharacterized protein YcnI